MTSSHSIAALLCCLSAVASAGGAETVEWSGRTMGTTYSVKVVNAPERLSPEELRTEVERLLAAANKRLSTYDDESELSRFNAWESTKWFAVSPETAELTRRALELAARSGGKFDPTVAPLIRLWNFDRDRGRPAVPSDEVIAAAAASVGYRKIEIRESPPALRKLDSRTELNLNAVAEGDTIDRIVGRLADLEVTSCLIEIGGEVRASGTKEDGTPWRIGIERPLAVPRSLEGALPLCDRAVATSGNYRNVVEIDGVRYSHLIDPVTARPVRRPMGSVTVVAEDCTTADGFATTLMLLGPEAGLRLADRHGVAAWFLIVEDGEVKRRASRAFREGPGKELELLQGSADIDEGTPVEPASSRRVAWIAMSLALAAVVMAGGRALTVRKS
jgi:thiamine biosynthesis lipoprotein